MRSHHGRLKPKLLDDSSYIVEQGCDVEQHLEQKDRDRRRADGGDGRAFDGRGDQDLNRVETDTGRNVEVDVCVMNTVQPPEGRHGMEHDVLEVDRQIKQDHPEKNREPRPQPDGIQQTPTAVLSGQRDGNAVTSTTSSPRLCGQRATRRKTSLRCGLASSQSAGTSGSTMSTSPKREVFENLARVGTALSSPVRIEFLELLAQTERTVEQLAAMTGASVANTSQHLQKLRQAGLIAGRKEGLYVFYRLAGDEVVGLLSAMSRVGETYVADVERILRLYFAQKDDLEPVPAKELLDRVRKGLVTVLDVRPPEEYAAGHVPGAINIPVHELQERLHDLRKRKEVIAYRRGAYCLMSYDALQDGLPEWRAAGLPVE